MAPAWTPVRVIRWPAQEQDRAWCADRFIPRVLIVPADVEQPEAGPAEVVLTEPVDEAAIRDAVDSLAWGQAPQAPDVSTPRRPRPRSLVGVVAALF